MGNALLQDYPETRQIVERLRFGRPHENLCLFVPSHTRDGKELESQAEWATKALKLFGDLFGGATAFKHLEGIFKPDDADAMYDSPIMVQTLTPKERVENEKSLRKLGEFCRMMGTETDQHSVGLVVNNYFINIRIGKK
ncbi:MAG: hypothetical protein ACM359_00570 [Bacillota bacterium]